MFRIIPSIAEIRTKKQMAEEIHTTLSNTLEGFDSEKRYAVSVVRRLFDPYIVMVRDTHELRTVFEVVVDPRQEQGICVFNLYPRKARSKKFFMTTIGIRNASAVVSTVLINKLSQAA